MQEGIQQNPAPYAPQGVIPRFIEWLFGPGVWHVKTSIGGLIAGGSILAAATAKLSPADWHNPSIAIPAVLAALSVAYTGLSAGPQKDPTK